VNRSLGQILCSAFLSAFLLAGCNHAPASSATAESNVEQNSQGTADAANDSKKGLLSGLFESSIKVTIPEGAQFEVTVDATLASNTNHAGDSFAASLSQPVFKDGKTIIPAGAHVTGRVVDAKDSGHLHVPARLSVALSSVEVDGKSYDIETNTVAKTGQNHNKRDRRRGRNCRSGGDRKERYILAGGDASEISFSKIRNRQRERLKTRCRTDLAHSSKACDRVSRNRSSPTDPSSQPLNYVR